MKNKFFSASLVVAITLICVYFLSFTWLANRMEKNASSIATTESGLVDPVLRAKAIDSMMVNPVASVLGVEYTLTEIKQRELHLGLDLQGGVNIVLEVSVKDLLMSLSGNSKDEDFNLALAQAKIISDNERIPYLNAFTYAFQQQAPERSLSEIFASAGNREQVTLESSDASVVSFLNEEIESAIERTYNILRTRIDKFGVSSPNIQRLPGSNRIQVELPGVDNPQRVRRLLQGVAKLEFREVYDRDAVFEILSAINEVWKNNVRISAAIQTTDSTLSADSAATDLAQLLTSGAVADSAVGETMAPIVSLLVPSYELAYRIQDTARVNAVLKAPAVRQVIPLGVEFTWAATVTDSEGDLQVVNLYATKTGRGGVAEIDGSYITDARQEFEKGLPMVSMQMNRAGAQKWKTMTRQNLGRQVAILLDGVVYTAPVVQSEIPNGNSSITGNFSVEEAKDLANVLEAGKLPASTKIVEEAVIGPSLGQDSITQGLISMLVGLGVVVLFMVAYYHKGGMIANLALLANIFFILGILAQFSAALTLPGIAGIVLTIGMSVDANVLIFERIKEELANGKTLRNAIQTGYERAFSSIIDSNATTFLVGLILYWFGMGVIKGFALVLMIGIGCSLLTAVFLTRWCIEWLAKRNAQLSFETSLSRLFFQRPSFDFLKNRKIAYSLSLIILLVGLIGAVVQGGFVMGVDFKGGRSYVVRFGQEVESSKVRQAVAGTLGGAGLEVKSFGSDRQFKITSGLLAGDDSEQADQTVAAGVQEAMTQLSDYKPEIVSSAKIGPTIASDIKDSARTSFLLCIGAIFMYILIRFRKWQYSAGAVIALVHDAMMIFAWFSIVRWAGVEFEVDQIFIAALLTVIGYSINDTVVVFDRIREFSGQKPGQSLDSLMNDSLNKTLSRTIITSLTVLIVVVILLAFGGAVLRGFSFALLIGVVFGTYSSIFIASPILIDFQAFRAARAKNNAKLVAK